MRNWKKMLIVVLLVSIGVGFEYSINPAPVHASSSKVNSSIVQKPTDKPKDKPIKIVVHDGGKYCYSPVFTREPLKTSLLDFQLKIKRLEPDAIEVKNIKKMLNSHFLNIFRISKKNQA
ncbi:hypothetical protein LEP1GSC021_2225 [Leptospira noguchii str. 1993005606]|nr:hypothetical protein LEP1GSC021_2225 [Leptospira noguchii str. 1993005606]